MALDSNDEVRPLLRCPRTGTLLHDDGRGGLAPMPINASALTYPIVEGVPILVDFHRSVLHADETIASAGASKIERHEYRGLAARVKRLISPPKEGTRRNVARFVERLKALSARPRVLVVGGGSVGQGMRPLYDDPAISVVAFDIYASPHVHFVGDAHQMPLADDTFDGLVAQAVLEHVLEPRIVAEEIWRVLRLGGIVYAETPFMQQVHEGPYDFTRFTESGHRNLFRRFERIDSGSNGGPALQLMWSIDYFVRGLFRSRAAGKAAKLLFFWLQYLDRLIPERYAVDGASGVFFMGSKYAAAVGPKEIVRHYRGAQ